MCTYAYLMCVSCVPEERAIEHDFILVQGKTVERAGEIMGNAALGIARSRIILGT